MKKHTYALFLCFCFLGIQNIQGQTAAADNKISESITFSEPPKGLAIYGVFEGRTPCVEICKQLGAELPRDCEKLKWQLILFRDSLTHQPTTYSLGTELFDRKALKGKWQMTKGTPTDPRAIIYVLNYGKQGQSIYLLKGDDNVLFILDKNRRFQTGNEHYSYTLNRVKKVRQLSKP